MDSALPEGGAQDLGAPQQYFDDVPPTHWAYHYISRLQQEKVVYGCSPGDPASQQGPKFCPDDPTTRGQAAVVIIRSLHGENFTYSSTPYFDDVPATYSLFKYIQKLKELDITKATGSYKPVADCLRGQMAALICRALYGDSFTYPSTQYFADVPSTYGFYKYIQKIKEQKFCTEEKMFLPDQVLYRDHMAAWIARAFFKMP